MSALPSLLDRLAIKAVYWVDDENATPAEMSIEKLAKSVAEELERSDDNERKLSLGKLRSRPTARGLAGSIEKTLKRDDLDDVVGAIVELFTTQLNGAVPEDPVSALNDMLSALPQRLKPQERKALMDAFQAATTWEWHVMSFSRWDAEHKHILDLHSNGGGNALLIVDMQNSCETSLTSGQEVLTQWAARISQLNGKMPLFAIAFSTKFRVAQELVEGRKFTQTLFEDMEMPAFPVLVISKDRLSRKAEDELPESLITAAFESTLGRLRTFTLHSSLAVELQDVFAQSTESAFKKLQQLSIEELLYAVTSSSFAEGVSEIDTMVRMATIAQREALLRNVVASNKIRQELIELRGLHDSIGRPSAKELDSIDGIEDLRCSELHDPAEVVNGLLSPVAPGDIFEIQFATGATEYHVLVSNACDLMLRGDTGSRKLQVGLLLSLGEAQGQSCGPDSMTYAVSHFPEGSPLRGKKCAVDLRQMRTAPLEVLDLSWNKLDGKCDWKRNAALPEELGFLPGQQRRYVNINSVFESINNRTQLHEFASWLPFVCTFASDPGSLTDVAFAVQRVGRLSSRIASELIQRFAQTLARPSQEHDFSLS
jgi:hypothetical protein